MPLNSFPIATADSTLTGAQGVAALQKAHDMPSVADVSAATLESKGMIKTPVFAFCGDSITADGTISPNQWVDIGWTGWFRRYCSDAAEFRVEYNFAVASTDSNYLVATQLPLLLASNATHVIVMSGNNDDIATVSTTARYQEFYEACTNANIVVIFIPVLPHSAPTAYDATRTAQVSAMNKWLIEKSKVYPNLYYIDTLKTIMDFSTGNGVSGFHRDGTHTTIEGSRLLGQAVYDGISGVLSTSTNITKVFNADSYSAAYNPNGSLYVNPLLLGTSGNTSNGATGTVASNLELRRKSSDTTSTVVGAIDTVEGYTSLNCQKITIGGDSNGNEQILILNNLPSFPATWVAGDTIELECMIKLVNPTGIRGLYLRGIFDGDGTYFDGKEYSNDGALTNQNVFTSNMGWTKYKVRKTLVDNTTTINARVYIFTTDGVAMNTEVYVAMPILQKITA
jgi:lysophospholipase L1-like esterase